MITMFKVAVLSSANVGATLGRALDSLYGCHGSVEIVEFPSTVFAETLFQSSIPKVARSRPLILSFPPGATFNIQARITLQSTLTAPVIFMGSNFTLDGRSELVDRLFSPMLILSSGALSLPTLIQPACLNRTHPRETLRCIRKTAKSFVQRNSHPVKIIDGSIRPENTDLRIHGVQFLSTKSGLFKFLQIVNAGLAQISQCSFDGGPRVADIRNAICLMSTNSNLFLAGVTFRGCSSNTGAGALYVKSVGNQLSMDACLFEDNLSSE